MTTSNGNQASRRRVLILGAGGRDFHNFNTVFRDNSAYEVVGFTATQIPNIDGRTYPAELAGSLYPSGIPIYSQDELPELITSLMVDEVVFSYSDISHLNLMHLASKAVATGADFRLLSARATMLASTRPVVSICAVRTGCGKSPLARFVARSFRDRGMRVAVIRHPMPYGDLVKQAVQRFGSLDDLARAECTIEEREEYEPHIEAGDLVFAGVDYERILRRAELEADIIIWDGGNNDLPFFKPDLEIVVADPHRPGHETTYYPGEPNLLRAGVVVLSKVDTANIENVWQVRDNVHLNNANATIIEMAMPLTVADPKAVRGKRVLVIEDGPTLSHGGMGYGAGFLAAKRFGAAELVDPRPYAVGSLGPVYKTFPHMGPILPAMGYGEDQMRDLKQTIDAVPCDVVLVASPVDLSRLLHFDKPAVRVRYEVEELGEPKLSTILHGFMAQLPAGASV
ncbi:MAG TPA: cyclic 2,3-diphosphoglycerate synthase [Dehalococcoidia bacterium]